MRSALKLVVLSAVLSGIVAFVSCGGGGGSSGGSAGGPPLGCSSDSSGQNCVIKVAAQKRFIDFGRNNSLRTIVSPSPVNRDAFPLSTGVFSSSPPAKPVPFPPPALVSAGIFSGSAVNVCQYVLVPPGPAGSTWMDVNLFSDPAHFNPIEYLGGSTCVYALVRVPAGGLGGAFVAFTLPDQQTGGGDYFAAVPVPSATAGGASIPMTAGRTVATVLPNGLLEGSVIDTFAKMDAYNATLTFLANAFAFPIDNTPPTMAGVPAPYPPGTSNPLATYDPLLPFPNVLGDGTNGSVQALPIIWEAPPDPDPGISMHDCVGHGGPCQIQRGGAHPVQASLGTTSANDFVDYHSKGPHADGGCDCDGGNCDGGCDGGSGDGGSGDGGADAGCFQCNNGPCIDRTKVCNGTKDCPGGEDEDPNTCGTQSSCCVATAGCPAETGSSCAQTCCCCPLGQRCCANLSGCCNSP